MKNRLLCICVFVFGLKKSQPYRSDQFTIVKLVGEHQPSLSPSPKIFVRFSLPPGISMSGLEKISLNRLLALMSATILTSFFWDW